MTHVSVNAIGWFVFAACITTSCAFSIAAHAEPPPVSPLASRIAALVPRFATKGAEPVDAEAFGVAVDTACKHDRECAARLVAMAIAESGLRLSVSLSQYKPHEGDAYLDRDGVRVHRAWGTWQGHKNALNAADWGSNDLLVQARAARAMQIGALAECRSFRGVVPEVAMFRILSGRGCLMPYSGEEKRMQLLQRIRRAL